MPVTGQLPLTCFVQLNFCQTREANKRRWTGLEGARWDQPHTMALLQVDDGGPHPLLKVADLGLGRHFAIPIKAYTHEVGGQDRQAELEAGGWEAASRGAEVRVLHW